MSDCFKCTICSRTFAQYFLHPPSCDGDGCHLEEITDTPTVEARGDTSAPVMPPSTVPLPSEPAEEISPLERFTREQDRGPKSDAEPVLPKQDKPVEPAKSQEPTRPSTTEPWPPSPMPKAGHMWRNIRVLRCQAEDSDEPQYVGAEGAEERPVLITQFRWPTESARRSVLRDKIPQLLDAQTLLPLSDIMQEPGEVVAVYRLGKAVPLDLSTVPYHEIEPMVRDLTTATVALHSEGFAHAHITPACIFVRREKERTTYLLGGHARALLTRPPTTVRLTPPDIRYAAPESEGGIVSVDEHLRSRDWWALGRVMETTLLKGRHVFDELFGGSHESDRAFLIQSLMREKRDATVQYRAGAVEFLENNPKVRISGRQIELLKGLLTTNVDGRWNHEHVLAWLEDQPVTQNYGLHTDQTLFTWNGRSYTVEDAALALMTADHWSSAVENTFNVHSPDTLVSYVTNRGADARHREYRKSLEALHEQKAFCENPDQRNDLITALFLLYLSRNRQGLVIRGKRVDAAYLNDKLTVAMTNDAALHLVRAMVYPAFVEEVEKLDSVAGGLLRLWQTTCEDSVTLLQQEIPDLKLSRVEEIEVRRLALLSDADLLQQVKELRSRFAASSNERAHAVLREEKPERHEIVFLLHLAKHADRYGFKTQEEWAQEETERLRVAAADLTAILAWLRAAPARNPVCIPFTNVFVAVGLGAVCAGYPAIMLLHVPWLLAFSLGAALAYAVHFTIRKAFEADLRRVAGAKVALGDPFDGDNRQHQILRITRSTAMPAIEAVETEIKQINEQIVAMKHAEGTLPLIDTRFYRRARQIAAASLGVFGIALLAAVVIPLLPKQMPVVSAERQPIARSEPSKQDTKLGRELLAQADAVRRDDPAKAYAFYVQSANAGSGSGAFKAAQMAENGEGTGVNMQQSVALLKRAVEFGSVDAMERLGRDLLKGIPGVLDQDQPAGVDLIAKAADRGSNDAANFLGTAYFTGEHELARNTQRAADLFTTAINRGDVDAMYNLGVLYIQADGGFNNPVRAADLFKRAADRGHKAAAAAYAKCLRAGFGVEANPAEALKYEARSR